MKRLNVRAVLFGVLADVLGSTACGALIASTGQVSPPRIEELILGLAFTFLGGYAAGRIAAQSKILNGGLVGAVSALLTIPLLFSSSLPVWFMATSIAGSIPVAAAGGYITS
jgi:hypothetical protein